MSQPEGDTSPGAASRSQRTAGSLQGPYRLPLRLPTPPPSGAASGTRQEHVMTWAICEGRLIADPSREARSICGPVAFVASVLVGA
jgi:hypothetical protein